MPARFAPILSALMSLLVSGVATLRNAGLGDGFFKIWINALLLPSWLVAFPVVLVVAPVTRRLVGLLVEAPAKIAR